MLNELSHYPLVHSTSGYSERLNRNDYLLYSIHKLLHHLTIAFSAFYSSWASWPSVLHQLHWSCTFPFWSIGNELMNIYILYNMSRVQLQRIMSEINNLLNMLKSSVSGKGFWDCSNVLISKGMRVETGSGRVAIMHACTYNAMVNAACSHFLTYFISAMGMVQLMKLAMTCAPGGRNGTS